MTDKKNVIKDEEKNFQQEEGKEEQNIDPGNEHNHLQNDDIKSNVKKGDEAGDKKD